MVQKPNTLVIHSTVSQTETNHMAFIKQWFIRPIDRFKHIECGFIIPIRLSHRTCSKQDTIFFPCLTPPLLPLLLLPSFLRRRSNELFNPSRRVNDMRNSMSFQLPLKPIWSEWNSVVDGSEGRLESKNSMETPQERGSDSESRSTESQETEDLEDLDCYFLYRTSLKNTVLDVLSGRAGWKETTNIVDWDLNWADTGWIRDHFSSLKLDDTQVSFPLMNAIC